MVVLGEILGQLVAGVVVGADDPTNHTGLLEHDQVAVHRALGQRRPPGQDVGDGERLAGVSQEIDQRPALGGVALLDGPEAGGSGRVEVSGGHPETLALR